MDSQVWYETHEYVLWTPKFDMKQSTLVVQIKGLVWDFVWTPEFDMKHMKKTEGYIGRNGFFLLEYI